MGRWTLRVRGSEGEGQAGLLGMSGVEGGFGVGMWREGNRRGDPGSRGGGLGRRGPGRGRGSQLPAGAVGWRHPAPPPARRPGAGFEGETRRVPKHSPQPSGCLGLPVRSLSLGVSASPCPDLPGSLAHCPSLGPPASLISAGRCPGSRALLARLSPRVSAHLCILPSLPPRLLRVPAFPPPLCPVSLFSAHPRLSLPLTACLHLCVCLSQVCCLQISDPVSVSVPLSTPDHPSPFLGPSLSLRLRLEGRGGGALQRELCVPSGK